MPVRSSALSSTATAAASRPSTVVPPWQKGWHAARAHWRPALALQSFALTLVLAYYYHAPTRQALAALVEFRAVAGLWFGLATTAFCGGVVPFFYLRAVHRPGERARPSWRQGLFLTAFWAYKGIEIELWYRLLASAIGTGTGPGTALLKMFCDQFVYCPLFAVPLTVLGYQMAEYNLNWRALRDDLRQPGWYGRRVLATQVSNLGVWVPAALLIFALPTALQLPLQNLVMTFFTLMLAHLNRHHHDADGADPA